MGERDNWESNCFAEIIASGDRISDLVDARVGAARLVVASEIIPKGARSLYLLHIAILAAWMDSKYRHAEDIRDKFCNREPLSDLVPANGALPVQEMLWSKMQSDLQIKSRDILLLILVLGQRTARAQIETIAHAAAAVREGSNHDSSRAQWSLSSIPETMTLGTQAPFLVPVEVQEWLTARPEPRLSHVGLDGASQGVVGAASRLLPLLKELLTATTPLDFSAAQTLVGASEELVLELKAYRFGLHRSTEAAHPKNGRLPSVDSVGAVQVQPPASPAPTAPQRRRIQPTAC